MVFGFAVANDEATRSILLDDDVEERRVQVLCAVIRHRGQISDGAEVANDRMKIQSPTRGGKAAI